MKIRLVFFLVLLFHLFHQIAAASGVDLNEAFQAALKRSEDLANQDELITQAEERFKQAKGAIFPSIDAVYNYLKQPTPGGLGSSIFPGDQTIAKITATQPLFRGFREFAALRQQKDFVSASQYAKDQAARLLFEEVVENFYGVLGLEKDLENLENEIAQNRKRLSELENFRRLGRSRETEVLSSESAIAVLEAQRQLLQGQINTNRDLFAFLTGLSRTAILQDRESPPDFKENLDFYLSRVELRPDVQFQAKSSEAAGEGITIARGGYFPSVDLLGNYYLTRPGLLSDVKWDLQIALTFPIFRGGAIQSQVRQAASLLKGSELALSKARRLAIQQIESLFHTVQTEISQIERQKKATELSLKTYQAQLRDYRLGLVTNLEVLTSLTASQSNQRLLDRIQYQVKIDFLKLQSASALKSFNPSVDSKSSKESS